MMIANENSPALPPEVVKRMHAVWERAFVEGSGLDADAGAAAEEFVAYALSILTRVYGDRDVSRQLYLLAQLFASQADAEATAKNSQH